MFFVVVVVGLSDWKNGERNWCRDRDREACVDNFMTLIGGVLLMIWSYKIFVIVVLSNQRWTKVTCLMYYTIATLVDGHFHWWFVTDDL